MQSERKFCFTCDEYVEPEYVCSPCIAPYGTVVTAKGYCPNCGRQIVKEHMVDDDGLHPTPRKVSHYGR